MSPEGIHHWKNGRDFYASDIVPLTFWASYLLDDIAGTRDNVPIMVNDDPQSLALAQDTDVHDFFPSLTGLVHFSGISNMYNNIELKDDHRSIFF